LSIEEYARIQQFPDNWNFIGNITSIYRQIGNAVPVGLGYAVGEQIMRHIKGIASIDDELHNKIPYSRYTNSMDSEAMRLLEPRINYKRQPK
ncbi:MAG: DNA cytosine methyltransferase, partial [Duncaniella sp.]|nr:DNA cytosine methyltransferase [Duncaniella sp.]